MIEARHHKVYEQFFKWYLKHIINRNFHVVNYVDCGYKKSDAAVLGIGNHMSWWDGFWMLELNRKYINKKFHVLMLENQLASRMFLNKIGAAGFTKNSRSIFTMLKYCSGLLQHSENILFYFPEGEIRPQNQNRLDFEKGVMRIINDSPQNLQLLFIVNLTEYFSNKKPTLFTFYKSFGSSEFGSLDELQRAYNLFMKDCKNQLNTYSQ